MKIISPIDNRDVVVAIANRLVGLCVAALLSGCVALSDDHEPVYLPSEINAHPNLYEGHEVRVRGWVVLRAENRNIWERKSDFRHLPDTSHCLALIGVRDWTGDESIDDKVMTISGVFHKYEPADKTALGMCSFSAIEVDTSKPPFGKR